VIESFRNIFAIPDLRRRVFFTFALLAVYRLGSFIPIPGIDPVAIAEFTKAAEGTLLGFINLFSGGALGRMTVFALGIMPYISASIILQLLTVVWPYLEKLSKEGELGRHGAHIDYRNGVRDVAWRADLGTRDRQWYLVDHLRGNRRRPAGGDHQHHH
jgi:preprotein translocase subunit SecY